MFWFCCGRECLWSLLPVSTLNCLSRLNCSYLFLRHFRRSLTGAYPSRLCVYSSVFLLVFPNKSDPLNPGQWFVFFFLQLKWITRAHLADSCWFLFAEKENLVISNAICANMGVFSCIFPSQYLKNRKYLYLHACLCILETFFPCNRWRLLLSLVVLQSKPFTLRGKYVQSPQAKALLIGTFAQLNHHRNALKSSN